MVRFTKETVLSIQGLIINTTGGRAGVRDYTVLDSAIESVFQTFDGKDLYPTYEEKAARLGYNLITNHAFVDGNKRVGILTMLTFLKLNGIKIKCSNFELIDVGMSLAKGNMKYDGLLNWIKCHEKGLERQF